MALMALKDIYDKKCDIKLQTQVILVSNSKTTIYNISCTQTLPPVKDKRTSNQVKSIKNLNFCQRRNI